MLLREAKRVLKRAGYRINEKIDEDGIKNITMNIKYALDDEFQKYDATAETEYMFRSKFGEGRMAFQTSLFDDEVYILIELDGISVRRGLFSGFSFGSDAELTININAEPYGKIRMRKPGIVDIDSINYKNFAKRVVANIDERINLRNFKKTTQNELE